MPATTQQFVPIREIRDNVAILKSGEMRAVILCQAINLDLKSADEQTAIIYQFQNFLNGLEFPIQIVASSRRLDIRPYILKLEDRLDQIKEDLLRIQTREYIGFIQTFNDTYDVMSKYFYVVVPYGSFALDIPGKGIVSGITGLFGGKKNNQPNNADLEKFEESRSQLEQRIAVVQGGLESLGMTCKQLDTAELEELYIKVFNPGELHSTAGALGQS